jgi:hypothetical protein
MPSIHATAHKVDPRSGCGAAGPDYSVEDMAGAAVISRGRDVIQRDNLDSRDNS